MKLQFRKAQGVASFGEWKTVAYDVAHQAIRSVLALNRTNSVVIKEFDGTLIEWRYEPEPEPKYYLTIREGTGPCVSEWEIQSSSTRVTVSTPNEMMYLHLRADGPQFVVGIEKRES